MLYFGAEQALSLLAVLQGLPYIPLADAPPCPPRQTLPCDVTVQSREHSSCSNEVHSVAPHWHQNYCQNLETMPNGRSEAACTWPGTSSRGAAGAAVLPSAMTRAAATSSMATTGTAAGAPSAEAEVHGASVAPHLVSEEVSDVPGMSAGCDLCTQ